MSVLILLLAASLIISSSFLIAFIVQTKRGQFDDMYGPAQKILFEEDSIKDKI